MTAIINYETAIVLLKEKHGNSIKLNRYSSMDSSDSEFECVVCGNIWETSAYSVIRSGSGCMLCSIKTRGDKRRMSYGEIKNFIENTKYYRLLDNEYFGTDKYLNIIDIYGYKYYTTFRNFTIQIKRGNNLYEFSKYNLYTIDNIILWLEINNIPLKYVDIENEYISDGEKNILFACSNCGKPVKTCWAYAKQGKGLCKCETLWHINGEHNNLAINFINLVKEWDYDKNNDNPEDYTLGCHDEKNWICSICGHKWKAAISNRTQGVGCPRCRDSKGEKIISNFLKENKIRFIHQFVFNNCKHKRKLPFDFYLPDYNMLIEYDGILHFEDKFNDPEEFKLTQYRDSIKTQYCQDNNIPLLRIPYWDFDNIEQILTEELSQYDYQS